jgi:hypothetical protein
MRRERGREMLDERMDGGTGCYSGEGSGGDRVGWDGDGGGDGGGE